VVYGRCGNVDYVSEGRKTGSDNNSVEKSNKARLERKSALN